MRSAFFAVRFADFCFASQISVSLRILLRSSIPVFNLFTKFMLFVISIFFPDWQDFCFLNFCKKLEVIIQIFLAQNNFPKKRLVPKKTYAFFKYFLKLLTRK
jgi:hypothetical protein